VELPDTEQNQLAYPRTSKASGCPLIRLVGIICLASGGILNAAIGSFSGKGSGEQALLRTRHALVRAECDQTEIAMIVGCHKSTISREIRRNTGLRGYRPKQAQRLTDERRQSKNRPSIRDDTWFAVEQLLILDWSPEQISLWLKAVCGISISHEWIYQFILQDKADSGDLFKHLRCQKQRRKRYGSYNRRGQLIDRISIDERPTVVDLRSRIGVWELDTIIGKGHRQAIASLTEHKSRYTLIRKVERKTAQCVSNAINNLVSPFFDYVLTMTSDNGLPTESTNFR